MANTSEHRAWITSSQHRLHGRLIGPACRPLARLLLLHGYGDHGGRYVELMRWLAGRGVSCNAFDFRGHGLSSGRRGFVRRWDEYLDDLRAMLDALPRDDSTPLFVLGHSHGGLIAAAAGESGLLSRAGVEGVILSAPYLRPAERLSPLWRGIAAATNLVAPALRVPNGLSAEMMSGDPTMADDSRNDPLLQHTATPRWYCQTLVRQKQVMVEAAKFTLPLFCLAGSADPVADPAASREFVSRVGSSSRRLEELPGQRHEILRETDRLRTFAMVYDWIQEQRAATAS